MVRPLLTHEQALELFWSKVDKTDYCWLWTGGLRKGYGGWENGRRYGLGTVAHRIAYRAIMGEIPSGLVLDHLCRVTHCVNPAHLEPVTQRVNTLRGDGITAKAAQQTHCKRNHELTPENTYGGRSRRCRTCAREWAKAQYDADPVKANIQRQVRRDRYKGQLSADS